MMQSQFLGEYHVIKQLQVSQYFWIYQVHSNKDQQNYTLKISQAQFQALGEHEREILKQFNIPQIIKFIDLKCDQEFQYVVLEYCEQTLDDFWNSKAKKIPETIALETLKQILNALENLEQKDVVHADLCMKNIVIKQNQCKIANFEWAHLNKKFLIKQQNYEYAAPELYSLANLTPKADIFSLGCILYAMLFGHYPFNQKGCDDYLVKIQKSQIQLNEQLTNGVSPFVIQLIYQMLQYNPIQRPTIQEIKNVLSTNIVSPQNNSKLWGINQDNIFETENFTLEFIQDVSENIMFFYQVAENFGGKEFYNWKKTMFPRFMLYKRSYFELQKFTKEARYKNLNEDVQKILQKNDKIVKNLKQVLQKVFQILQQQSEYKYPIDQWEEELVFEETPQFINNCNKAISFVIDYFIKSQIPFSKQQNKQQNLREMLILLINLQNCLVFNPYHNNQDTKAKRQQNLGDYSIENLLKLSKIEQ